MKKSKTMMKPKRSLGQNFLVDGNITRKIVDAVFEDEPKNILEIGPGPGALTKVIGERGKGAQGFQFALVEKDDALAKNLLSIIPAATLFNADFLEFDLHQLPFNKDKAVAIGNLPYNVSSQILIKLLKERSHFSNLYLMFQKEMAERMVAKPGVKAYGLLSLWSQIYAEPKILFHIPPTVFRPRPKVWSSFVRFKIREESLLKQTDEGLFWELIPALFQHRRKIIMSVIRSNDKFKHLLETKTDCFEKNARIEEMNPAQIVSWVKKLNS